MNITPLSQRNEKWRYKKLGSGNTLTLGDYGCVVTCFTMLVNYITGKKYGVDDINAILVNGGAFYQDTLMWWTEVPKALSYMKFEWRGWSYENDKVADYIYNKGIPVIVQVDAAPIGSPRSDHYVLYIGDGKCADPWDGIIKPISTYPDTKGYILYSVDKSKLPTGNDDALNACLTAHKQAVEAANKKDTEITELKKQIEGLKATEDRLKQEKDQLIKNFQIEKEKLLSELNKYKSVVENIKKLLI